MTDRASRTVSPLAAAVREAGLGDREINATLTFARRTTQHRPIHPPAAAQAARRRAIAGNWCAAAALDDDELDIPGYKPRFGWRPATGTGFAADSRPPKRAQVRRGA